MCFLIQVPIRELQNWHSTRSPNPRVSNWGWSFTWDSPSSAFGGTATATRAPACSISVALAPASPWTALTPSAIAPTPSVEPADDFASLSIPRHGVQSKLTSLPQWKLSQTLGRESQNSCLISWIPLVSFLMGELVNVEIVQHLNRSQVDSADLPFYQSIALIGFKNG